MPKPPKPMSEPAARERGGAATKRKRALITKTEAEGMNERRTRKDAPAGTAQFLCQKLGKTWWELSR